MKRKYTNKKLKEMVKFLYANEHDSNVCNDFVEYAFPSAWVDRTNEQERLFSTLCTISSKVSKELNLDYTIGGYKLFASVTRLMAK